MAPGGRETSSGSLLCPTAGPHEFVTPMSSKNRGNIRSTFYTISPCISSHLLLPSSKGSLEKVKITGSSTPTMTASQAHGLLISEGKADLASQCKRCAMQRNGKKMPRDCRHNKRCVDECSTGLSPNVGRSHLNGPENYAVRRAWFVTVVGDHLDEVTKQVAVEFLRCTVCCTRWAHPLTISSGRSVDACADATAAVLFQSYEQANQRTDAPGSCSMLADLAS
eukprot:COSAG02_NODE_974_length_15518_cov_97.334717_15_plen_223_part_00